jgi:hypothetical protein
MESVACTNEFLMQEVRRESREKARQSGVEIIWALGVVVISEVLDIQMVANSPI